MSSVNDTNATLQLQNRSSSAVLDAQLRLVLSTAIAQFTLDVGEIVVNEWSVFLFQPSKFALDGFQVVI